MFRCIMENYAALQRVTTGGHDLLNVRADGSHDRGSGEAIYKITAEMLISIECALGMQREKWGGKRNNGKIYY